MWWWCKWMLLLLPLRKDASRLKASPRVDLTLIHCQAPQKWLNHLSVWAYWLSVDCWAPFPPLGIRSEPSVPWAVPFCRPRRSVKGNYNGMLLNGYLCFTLTLPIFSFHFPFFLPLLHFSPPRMTIKKKKKEEEERNLTQCCWEPCEAGRRKPWCCPPTPSRFQSFAH